MLRKLTLSIICIIAILSASLRSSYAIILVQVSGLSDMSLPSWNIGDGDVNGYINLCVHSTLTANYNVTVSSAGGYKLTSGMNNITYSLSWDSGGVGNLGNSTGTQLSNGVALTNLTGASILSASCIAGPNARLNLKITQAAMTAALAGTYTGTVTIMVTPV